MTRRQAPLFGLGMRAPVFSLGRRTPVFSLGRRTLIFGVGLWSVGCGSDDSSTDPTVDSPGTIVLVQGVLRADQPQQWILLERTFNGTIGGEALGLLPGAGVAVPLEGADVTITNLSFPADPCGTNVPLLEDAGPADRLQPGAYWSPVGCPTIRTGDTLDLSVVSGDDQVTGRTIVPGTNGMTLEAGGVSVVVPGPVLEFNRDADTLLASVDPAGGRVLVVEIGERAALETLEQVAAASSFFWADATELTLPGDFLDIFGNLEDLGDEDPEDLFTAGRLHSATLAYADQNFYDQLRSSNLEITGRGFINNLVGGWGYFGSMTAAQTDLRVIGDVDDPAEGLYRTTGTIEDVAVTLDWELYLNRLTEDPDDTGTQFSTFLEGDWVLASYDSWTTGTIFGTTVETFIEQPTGAMTPEGEPELRRWEIIGELSLTGSSTLRVFLGGVEVGTLTATRQ